uniref:Secreted protein n=1 Tax=Oryza meridionalis TaxID=40149 RepID=A0A0E0E797_9ORYZ
MVLSLSLSLSLNLSACACFAKSWLSGLGFVSGCLEASRIPLCRTDVDQTCVTGVGGCIKDRVGKRKDLGFRRRMGKGEDLKAATRYEGEGLSNWSEGGRFEGGDKVRFG